MPDDTLPGRPPLSIAQAPPDLATQQRPGLARADDAGRAVHKCQPGRANVTCQALTPRRSPPRTPVNRGGQLANDREFPMKNLQSG